MEGRMSSRKPFKTISTHKQSHKRSQSLNKSTIEQRYRSVPQSGHHYECDNKRKSYTKKKLNCLFNNRTPQIHMSKGKYTEAKLDFNIKNAKKNLQNCFKDQYNHCTAYQKNFASLTGREKGNALLRKVYLRMEHENPANVSFRNMENKKNESLKISKNGLNRNKENIKRVEERFASPRFRSERSNSRKVENYSNQQKLSQNSKCNISEINKIQNLLASIKSSRSNKISKGGTDGVKKHSSYKHDSAEYKSTIDPKINNYRDYGANEKGMNHHNFYDSNSITNNNHKKNKVLKYFNGGGRQIFEQLCNKLRKYENLKSLYSSNETIKNPQNNTSINNGKFNTVKAREDSKTRCNINDSIMKKYQKEITMIAKKKKEYMLAQAKNLKKNKFNNLAIKTSQINNSNNVNTTASTILMSLVGNANNLSITEYPGMNESLASLNQDFVKYKIGEYPPSANHKNKHTVGRNSTK